MKKRKLFALPSFALACAMVLGSAPAPVAAVAETSENGELTIVREDTSLRREYEKHFLMSDGSYQAVVYDEPVHQLVDGAWEEIDNIP